MMKKTIFILLFSFTTFFVYGFELETTSQSGQPPFLKWDTSKGPVVITLNSNGSKDVKIARVEETLLAALGEWQSASNQTLLFQYAGKSSYAVANNYDSKNSVLWIDKGWQYSNSVLAVTKYTYYSGDPAYFADVDILMNGEDFRWAVDAQPGSGSIDIKQVLLHEFGHACGLAHSSRYKARMYPYLYSKALTAGLIRDDKAGSQFLYNNLPNEFAPFTPLSKSIYVADMARKGLTLPVFRWGTGGQTNFTLEFSATRDFRKRYTIPTYAANFYALKASDERKLQQMAVKGKIWWRITSGTQTTKAYSLRFKQIN